MTDQQLNATEVAMNLRAKCLEMAIDVCSTYNGNAVELAKKYWEFVQGK